MKATPYNQKTIDEFHAKQGRGVGPFGDHVVLMTAKGAKSGEAITTPLVGGLKANPEVEVEVPTDTGTEKFKARAHVVDDRAEHDRLYEEMTKIWPSFADYQQRTDRLIPVVRLERHD